MSRHRTGCRTSLDELSSRPQSPFDKVLIPAAACRLVVSAHTILHAASQVRYGEGRGCKTHHCEGPGE
jgi:hypothetical protein